MNRLNLNFQLQTENERVQFINNYVNRPEFIKKPLTNSELETIANYILWGDREDGEKETSIDLPSKSKTWKPREDESLDALFESPNFQEASIKGISAARPLVRKEKFSRTLTRKTAPEELLPTYEALWRNIDETELLINFYELNCGKRKNPPRPALLERFTEEEQADFLKKSFALSPYQYLKRRHLLVELCREQFTIRDTFSPTKTRHNLVEPYAPSPDLNIEFAPLGLAENARAVLFPSDGSSPTAYFPPISSSIDLRDPSTLSSIFLSLSKFETPEFAPLFTTLTYYVRFAHLSPIHEEIFFLKLKHTTNPDICAIINPKYSKTYNPNYISTIFHKKILVEIADAISYHAEIVSHLNDPHAFKRCSGCGATLLLSARNFTRKAKSPDGFQSRCKQCERAKRKGVSK